VAQQLTSAGWHHGRDVSAEHEAWLRGWVRDFDRDVELRELWTARWERMPAHLRVTPIQLHDAARRVLAEFGGLTIRGGGRGRGVTPPRVVLFPAVPSLNAPVGVEEMVELAQGLGVACWPVGRVGEESYEDALAVDERGRVFVVGPWTRAYAGASFDEALTNLVTGTPLAPVPDDWMWWHRPPG
jgi:hypothetical protein